VLYLVRMQQLYPALPTRIACSFFERILGSLYASVTAWNMDVILYNHAERLGRASTWLPVSLCTVLQELRTAS
jgi:hypothetical protein